MAQVSGIDLVVGVYDETAWGEDPGTPAGRKLCLNTLDIQPNQSLIQSAAICGGGRGVRRPGRGKLAPAGTILTEIAPETIGFWLKHLLGAPGTAGADPYTHTFVPTDLPEGFQVEKDWEAELTDKVERFAGCRIGSATITIPEEGFCTASLNVLAKTHTVNAAPLDAALDTPGHTGFTASDSTVKEDGTELCTVRSATLTVSNNLDEGLYTLCSGGQRAALPEGRCAISGTLDTVFDSFDLYDKAIASTETTVELLMTRGDGLGSAGNESLSLLVDHADIQRASPPLETEAGITVTLNYTGFADGTDLGLEAVLKNAVAAVDL